MSIRIVQWPREPKSQSDPLGRSTRSLIDSGSCGLPGPVAADPGPAGRAVRERRRGRPAPPGARHRRQSKSNKTGSTVRLRFRQASRAVGLLYRQRSRPGHRRGSARGRPRRRRQDGRVPRSRHRPCSTRHRTGPGRTYCRNRAPFVSEFPPGDEPASGAVPAA